MEEFFSENLLSSDTISEFSALNNLVFSCFAVDLETQKIVYANSVLYARTKKKPSDVLHHEYFDVFSEELSLILDVAMGIVSRSGFYSFPHHIDYKDEWLQFDGKKIFSKNGRAYALFTAPVIKNDGVLGGNGQNTVYYNRTLNIPNEYQLEKDISNLHSLKDVSLLHFHIENFSNINLIYDWETGDYLLEQIRDWLFQNSIPGSKIYFTGEVFAILIFPTTLKNSKKYGQEILKRFNSPWKTNENFGKNLYCFITIGIISGEYLVKDIRKRLLRTLSTNSSGSLIIYNEEMDRNFNEKIKLRQILINSIQQDMEGFFVQYQPIYSAKKNKYVGAEALCRWSHPEYGLVSPSIFIPELEHLGFITTVDDWVFKTALRDFSSNSIFIENNIYFNVNLSPMHLINKNSTKNNLNLLKQAGFKPELVTLEITETSRFDFSADNLQHLNYLQSNGPRIALDDFGTGYNSLENLIKLPINILKTDRAFIADLETNSYLQYLLKSMVNISHAANMHVVSEGVETVGQKQLLESFGVDFMQGFLFDKPLYFKDFLQKIIYQNTN